MKLSKLFSSVAIVISVSFLCSGLLATPVFAALGDGGVYCLGNSFSEAELTNPNVTGLALRVHWEDIEPRRGVYDWSSLDANIQKAIAYNKKISIRVSAGQYTPGWVYEDGAEAFNYTEDGVSKTMPIPWDLIYLADWIQVIRDLGYRYRNLPNLVTVHITGPAEGGEMHLGDKGNQSAWMEAGYSDQKLVKAWKTVINAFRAAFRPGTSLGLSISNTVSFQDSSAVPNSVLNYAYKRLYTRLRVQGNWLAAKTSDSFDMYQLVKYYSNYTDVGFQMLCPAADAERLGGTLREAIDRGLAAGASYLEIYGGDVENPDYADDLQYADHQLKLQEGF